MLNRELPQLHLSVRPGAGGDCKRGTPKTEREGVFGIATMPTTSYFVATCEIFVARTDRVRDILGYCKTLRRSTWGHAVVGERDNSYRQGPCLHMANMISISSNERSMKRSLCIHSLKCRNFKIFLSTNQGFIDASKSLQSTPDPDMSTEIKSRFSEAQPGKLLNT